MKRFIAGIIIGLAAYFAFQIGQKATAPSEKHSPATRTLPEPTLSPPQTVQLKSLRSQFKSIETEPATPRSDHAPVSKRYTEVPESPLVEFEMINGMAVAFGDTVLGLPSGDFKDSHGITDLDRPRLWPSNEIPYSIDSNIVHPERIQQAIAEFNERTQVRFVPYSGQADALLFTKGEKNCLSYVGKIGGIQPIYLEPKCGADEVTHELMHALGFSHEQSRIDRDQYISIVWENIDPKFHSQFAMVPEIMMEIYAGSPFDLNSILMYDPSLFATEPGKETMKLKDGRPIPPKKEGLSPSDIQRLNQIYHP